MQRRIFETSWYQTKNRGTVQEKKEIFVFQISKNEL